MPCLIFLVACSAEGREEGRLRGADGEQPELVFRCEQGRIEAYLVMSAAEGVGSGIIGDGAVRVQLDSAPPCASAP